MRLVPPKSCGGFWRIEVRGLCHSIVSDFGGFMKLGMQVRSRIHIHTVLSWSILCPLSESERIGACRAPRGRHPADVGHRGGGAGHPSPSPSPSRCGEGGTWRPHHPVPDESRGHPGRDRAVRMPRQVPPGVSPAFVGESQLRGRARGFCGGPGVRGHCCTLHAGHLHTIQYRVGEGVGLASEGIAVHYMRCTLCTLHNVQ